MKRERREEARRTREASRVSGPDGCPGNVRRGGISPAINIHDGRGYPSTAQVWRMFIRWKLTADR
ncbi:MAG: hypothetical protein HYX78_07735 [Armatimonadetes bacterium]|nr:hypothetical protein [Armatimonadota bacterium]